MRELYLYDAKVSLSVLWSSPFPRTRTACIRQDAPHFITRSSRSNRTPTNPTIKFSTLEPHIHTPPLPNPKNHHIRPFTKCQTLNILHIHISRQTTEPNPPPAHTLPPLLPQHATPPQWQTLSRPNAELEFGRGRCRSRTTIAGREDEEVVEGIRMVCSRSLFCADRPGFSVLLFVCQADGHGQNW